MEADYSSDLGPGSAALELPWHDPEGRWHYVSLRGKAMEPTAAMLAQNKLDRIPEARRFPALRRLLEHANSPQSSWQSVKCGVWAEAAAPGKTLFGEPFEHGSYVDLVLAAPRAKLRFSLAEHEHYARELAAMLEEEEAGAEATAAIVVRR